MYDYRIILNERVIKAVKKEKYIGVFRLKENNKKIYEDAKGLFKIQKSKEFKYESETVKYWTDVFEYRGNKVRVIKYIERDYGNIENMTTKALVWQTFMQGCSFLHRK